MASAHTTDLEIRAKFKKLQLRAQSIGLTGTDLAKLETVRQLQTPKKYEKYLAKVANGIWYVKAWVVPAFLWTLLVVSMLAAVFIIQWPIPREKFLRAWFEFHDTDMEKEPCVLDVSESVADYLRPPVDCKMCRGLTSVDRVENITPEQFEAKYAYTGRPVLIVDATKNWTALQTFSFDFFKNIYSEDSPALHNQERNCQFFPYKTSFGSLSEVFNMSQEQSKHKVGTKPWYIGWSNCDSSAANVLRTHYSKPYFLPRVAESSKTDWIFMGCPGYGAHMHIDNVGLPSWQALVTGQKQWVLEPPPECYHECAPRIEVLMQQGDMIVVDTNIWFHSTLILGQDISIAIGSEFD